MLILQSDWHHQYSDVIHRVLAIVTMRLCLQEYSISHPLCPPPLLTPLLTPLPSPSLPARFYHLFPALAEGAMDSLLDLVEEENDQVREGGRGGGGGGGGGKYVAEVLLLESVSDDTLPPPSLPPSLSSFSPSLPPSLPQIRRTAIKALPDICKYSSDPSLCTKVAEYLTQLLATGSVTTHTITHSHPHTLTPSHPHTCTCITDI